MASPSRGDAASGAHKRKMLRVIFTTSTTVSTLRRRLLTRGNHAMSTDEAFPDLGGRTRHLGARPAGLRQSGGRCPDESHTAKPPGSVRHSPPTVRNVIKVCNA